MSALQEVFKDRKAFVGYLCAGDGGLDYGVDCALALVKGGVDVLEIGLPFSDPVADGPVIQEATQRALAGGAGWQMAREMARAIRQESQVPLVLMTYANPLLAHREDLQEASALWDAILLVDLPPEDPLKLRAQVRSAGMACPMLLSSTTPEKRARTIIKEASGFLYYVAQKGTTGVREGLPSDFSTRLGYLKAMTDQPMVAGFGIGNRAASAQVLELADGFVVGSAFVKLMAQKVPPPQLTRLAESLDPRITK